MRARRWVLLEGSFGSCALFEKVLIDLVQIYFALRLKGEEGFSPFQFYIWAKRKRKPFSDDDTITACSVGIVLGCRLACGTPGTWIVRRDADFRREPFGQVGDYFQAAL